MSRTIAFPPGTDGRALLAPLNSGAWEASPEYRRAITECDPLLFAITYLSDYLRQPDSGAMSFSPMHLDMARRAQQWVARRPLREGLVGPRDSAKSTWLFLILPLWALAHSHRGFLLGFSYTADLANGHLANLLDILHGRTEQSARLLADFPGLRPVRGAGGSTRTVLESGATIAARGMGAASLGIRSGAMRPDLIIGDDLEPGEADYGPEAKAKAVKRLVQNILPMNDRAVVQITGTTTAPGSMIHDLVKSALGEPCDPWVADEGFVAHYWPGILDEGTDAERSLWPQRWALSDTHLGEHRRGTRSFLLNMMNRPDQVAANGYWTDLLFRYDPRVQVVRRVLSVDVAVTNNRTSDQTAIVALGATADGRKVVVEHAEAGRWPGAEVRERIWRLAQAHPRTLREVVVEVNQGGDLWRDTLSPLPPGVRLELYRVHGSKRSRLEAALDHYQRGAVVHARELVALEEQAKAWSPAADRDDLLDALAGGLRYLFTGTAAG